MLSDAPYKTPFNQRSLLYHHMMIFPTVAPLGNVKGCVAAMKDLDNYVAITMVADFELKN
jgi:hypothetical protein